MTGRRLALRRPIGRYGGLVMTRHAPPVYLVNSAFGAFLLNGTNTNDQITIGSGADILAQPLGHDIPFTMKFTHANILNNSELTTLFDQYKILKVEVYATFAHNVSTAGGLSTLPQLCWHVDRDDSAIEGVAATRERMGIRRKPFESDKRTRKMWVTAPTAMAALFDQATGSTNIAAPVRRWIDCNDINIPHYGIKGVLENCFSSGTANVFCVRFDVKYTIAYRHVR